ncbi:hypothetical protein [Pararhizobium sp. PWRC1-1]|uniref:hypothetical protein n=1 Tax=Pararhizobium sp. PWRC1-1 TaxID=2804566 RepID=UPI003CF70F7B
MLVTVVPDKFAQLATPFSRHVIGNHPVVTVEVGYFTILERNCGAAHGNVPFGSRSRYLI